jgi:PhzF family phenazine biosynthesis protein
VRAKRRRGPTATTPYQVDAFTDVPFRGNPAVGCILQEQQPEDWMQAVAREMNVSETAFLHAIDKGYRLRWFTPETEVELCGHATLASAHILWETERLSRQSEAVFDTLSGILKARSVDDEIELDFPAATVELVAVPSVLDEALKVSATQTLKNESFF